MEFKNHNQVMPWFGLDIGGTLVKLVFFEPTDGNNEDWDDVFKSTINYFKNNIVGDIVGIRDKHLQINNVLMDKRRGNLHFVRFQTSEITSFFAFCNLHNIPQSPTTVIATGGGAYKYEKEFQKLGVQLYKIDEFESLVRGILSIPKLNFSECFYWQHPKDLSKCEKVSFDFSEPYPFLIVNIGSGVSILLVEGQNSFRRVTGTSLGGGTFLGLCCLLTGCNTYEEAIDLATKGSSTNVDKLVKDIYGGDCLRFGLSGDLVASSFGQMMYKQKRNNISKEDLASATLVTITNNIGSIAYNCATMEKIQHVVFLGNFLRINTISTKLLAYAMEYWSAGKLRALFFEHEGYFGALGCLFNLSS